MKKAAAKAQRWVQNCLAKGGAWLLSLMSELDGEHYEPSPCPLCLYKGQTIIVVLTLSCSNLCACMLVSGYTKYFVCE